MGKLKIQCELCREQISYKQKDDGTTQGEWEYEYGHKPDCRYYETSDRIKADRDEEFNISEYIKSLPAVWTKEDEREHQKLKVREFLVEKGFNV